MDQTSKTSGTYATIDLVRASPHALPFPTQMRQYKSNICLLSFPLVLVRSTLDILCQIPPRGQFPARRNFCDDFPVLALQCFPDAASVLKFITFHLLFCFTVSILFTRRGGFAELHDVFSLCLFWSSTSFSDDRHYFISNACRWCRPNVVGRVHARSPSPRANTV